MARVFNLPDLGEGIHEAEVQDVKVSVGDEVEEDQTILVVETDKAAVDIPSPYAGVVEDIQVQAGDWIQVGDTLMTFSGGAEEEEEPEETEAHKADAGQPSEPKAEEEAAQAPETEKADADTRPVPASPATRRLARELGVNLRQVPASGPSGRVTSEDVRAFAERESTEEKEKEVSKPEGEKRKEKEAPTRPLDVSVPSLPDFNRWGSVERMPLRSVRRETAKRMAISWSQVPHVTHQDVADITALDRLRRKYKEEVKAQEGSLTLTVFTMKAIVSALRAYPRVNSSLDPEAGEIILKNYYHIGIAVDTDRGLIVPVIRDVDQKSITELAIELQDLAQRTRDGKASLEEMQGGTFTITNVGIIGGTSFSPIINYPEVAILGMARARWQPVVRQKPTSAESDKSEGQMETVPRFMLPLILTFDHRVLDGADAARFMRHVIQMLENPEKFLLMV
jgi:pyruvate dehydrogenase E2 component (dihydrolipoamide acetyltransferase)